MGLARALRSECHSYVPKFTSKVISNLARDLKVSRGKDVATSKKL